MSVSRNAAPIASALAISITLLATPVRAQSMEELKARLVAQEQVNELLKQRIETLEAELEGRKTSVTNLTDRYSTRDADDFEAEDAIGRIFIRRGVAVLSSGVVELTPGLIWSHSGGNPGFPTDDLYGVGLDARIGLPGGWMLGAYVPVLHRKLAGEGSTTGLGDASATVWKSILAQDGKRPSLVASIRYSAPTAKDVGSDNVPLGSGFHSITGRLSSARTIAPIALYGDVSYTKFVGETVRGVNVDRSDIFGFGLGASLAVTPDISVNTGVNFDFEGDIAVNGSRINGSGTTKGIVDLGMGAVLKRNVFLNFSAGFGVTDDSPDITLGITLPVRF